MRSLQTLDLDENDITQLPDEVGSLKDLVTLTIRKNQIRKLPNTIGSASKLRQLDLGSNYLRSLPPSIQGLQDLHTLILSDNELTCLPPELGKARNLQYLDLESNNLREIPPQIGFLSNLDTLNLRDNVISTLPKELGNLPDSINLLLDGNPLAEPLPALVARGTPALLTYLRSLNDGTPQYEAKLLLVGEGGVGKSSLISALRRESFLPDRPTTHGIEINKLVVQHPSLETNIELNSWDFGGQEVYRITHQFFFSKRALYLVVWKPREGHEENNVEAWCRRIKLRIGGRARIVIVATHSRERRAEFDYETLQAKFPNLIVGYIQVDSETLVGIDMLEDLIGDQAARLPQMGEILSESWAAARDEVLRLPDAHISRNAFERICARHGLDEESAEILGDLLHDLGHIIHYADDDGLRDIVVLQPEWLTKAIGYVLEDENTRNNGGVLRHSELATIWANEDGHQRYPHRLHPYFLRLMEKFDVSYRLANQESSLVAQLVPFGRPAGIWQDKRQSTRPILQMVCKLDDEAPGIIAWLTVRNHRFTTGKHWRKGVLLQHSSYGVDGLIELDSSNREITISVVGPSPDYFFHILTDSLEELIGQRWRGLGYTFYIPCRKPTSTGRCRGLFSLKSVTLFRQRGQERIACHECAEESDVAELLTGFGKLSPPIDRLVERIEQIATQERHSIGQSQALLSEIARYTRNTLKIVSTEVTDCPRLFTVIPRSRKKIVETVSPRSSLEVTLWCEEPGNEHPCLEARYPFKPTKEWIDTVGPYLAFLSKLLRTLGPIGAAAYGAVITDDALKTAKADLDLMKALSEKFPDSIEKVPDKLSRGMTRAEGSALRGMRMLLTRLDRTSSFGGLRRIVTSSGDILWLCPHHYARYEPGLPNV